MKSIAIDTVPTTVIKHNSAHDGFIKINAILQDKKNIAFCADEFIYLYEGIELHNKSYSINIKVTQTDIEEIIKWGNRKKPTPLPEKLNKLTTVILKDYYRQRKA